MQTTIPCSAVPQQNIVAHIDGMLPNFINRIHDDSVDRLFCKSRQLISRAVLIWRTGVANILWHRG